MIDGGEVDLVLERVARLLADYPPGAVEPTEFLAAQFDYGLAWVHFPVGHGGLGVAREHQELVRTTLDAAGAPTQPHTSIIGLGMAGPVVATHGSDAQKQRYLRPIFTGEEIWCQLFSEPTAGSDVAGLATSAVRDGDQWILNGQKVWTSFAHMARFGLVAARSDPSVPKHKGLTYFVLDMAADGVEVRPLRQLTGDAEFNEVFLTDVRVPDSERLGAVGDGWNVVLTTLMNERMALRPATLPPVGAMETALQLWTESPHKDSVMRDRLVRLWTQAECLRFTALRAAAGRRSDGPAVPGPEGSVGKLGVGRLNQEATDFCLDLLGAEGMLYGSYHLVRDGHGDTGPGWAFLRARANSVEGGTSEVMKNVLAERVLGLPGDVRVDRDLPWREVPRN